MIPEQNDIERIENYLSGRMERQDRLPFESEMQEDPALQQEVAAYRMIFEGFAGLRSVQFSQQLNAWSGEWSDSDEEETELIEAYLAGELSESLNIKIEKRIAEEPEFRKKVGQYRTLVGGLNNLKSESFSEKLADWHAASSTEESHTTLFYTTESTNIRTLRSLWTRVAAAAAILLLLGFGAYWYIDANYSGPALVADFYQTPNLVGNAMGEQSERPAFDQLFQRAHQLLKDGAYAEADETFQQVLQQLPDVPMDALSKTYIRHNAEWSQVLARIGMGDNTAAVNDKLRSIAENPEHEYQSRAEELLEKMNSFWRSF